MALGVEKTSGSPFLAKSRSRGTKIAFQSSQAPCCSFPALHSREGESWPAGRCKFGGRRRLGSHLTEKPKSLSWDRGPISFHLGRPVNVRVGDKSLAESPSNNHYFSNSQIKNTSISASKCKERETDHGTNVPGGRCRSGGFRPLRR